MRQVSPRSRKGDRVTVTQLPEGTDRTGTVRATREDIRWPEKVHVYVTLDAGPEVRVTFPSEMVRIDA